MDIFIVNLTCCNLPVLHREHPAPERTLLNSNHSTPKIPNRKTWIILYLLLSGIYLLYGSVPANAAQLLDVRIGEYDGFTRIVFEVDTPAAAPRIDIPSIGKLSVAFDRTDVNLVRKIPVERSRHIESIQFWQHDGRLKTVLLVDYPYFRYETFPLSNPPRIAVDIFPTAAPVSEDTKPAGSESPSPIQPEPSHEDEATEQATVKDTIENTGPVTIPPSEKSADIDERTEDRPVKETAELPRQRVRPADQKNEIKPSPSQSSRKTTFRLQFFLVIGLVVITIGILFLLLMMIFARHRFSEVKTKLSTNDVLQQQDRKIEALNSQIQEQFERYDKA